MLSIQAQKGRHKGGREEKSIDYPNSREIARDYF